MIGFSPSTSTSSSSACRYLLATNQCRKTSSSRRYSVYVRGESRTAPHRPRLLELHRGIEASVPTSDYELVSASASMTRKTFFSPAVSTQKKLTPFFIKNFQFSPIVTFTIGVAIQCPVRTGSSRQFLVQVSAVKGSKIRFEDQVNRHKPSNRRQRFSSIVLPGDESVVERGHRFHRSRRAKVDFRCSFSNKQHEGIVTWR